MLILAVVRLVLVIERFIIVFILIHLCPVIQKSLMLLNE